MELHERNRPKSADRADERNGHLIGDVEPFQEHLVSALEFGGKTGELCGELVKPWIVHARNLSHSEL